jgi:hypothetical protein
MRCKKTSRQDAKTPGRQDARTPGRQDARTPERQNARAPERQSARTPGRQDARTPRRQDAKTPRRQDARTSKTSELPRAFRRAVGPAVCLAQAGRPGFNAPTFVLRRAVSPAVCPGAPIGWGLRRDACLCMASLAGVRRSVHEALGNWPGLQPSEPRWGMLKPSPRGLGYANCRAYGPRECARQLGDLAAFFSVFSVSL